MASGFVLFFKCFPKLVHNNKKHSKGLQSYSGTSHYYSSYIAVHVNQMYNYRGRPEVSASTCSWYLYLITHFQVLVLDI